MFNKINKRKLNYFNFFTLNKLKLECIILNK